MGNLVVAHCQDGRVFKGTTLDLDAGRPNFHVRTPQGNVLEVRLDETKAVFFVRSLDGESARQDRLYAAADDMRGRGASLVAFRFTDGEVMVGFTIRYPPVRPFFFVVPADAGSNNIRVLVARAAVAEMESPPATLAPRPTAGPAPRSP